MPISYAVRTVLVAMLAVAADGTHQVGTLVDSELVQPSGPAMILQDSVVLVESDSLHVGSPISLLVGSDSSLYITDGFANTVTRFAWTGEPARVYGQQGRGPGEI